MKYDIYGQTFTNSKELCDLLYKDPTLDLSLFKVEDSFEFNSSVASLTAEIDILNNHEEINDTIEDFDLKLQNRWHMSQEYRDLDIASYILGLCKQDHEMQRVGTELLLYQERNLFNLLRYLKYLIDTLRKNNIVWGVGRGSSVSSYVLFLLGVHKIDSLYYDLDINEFLK
jgi:DNA polymerase III alpha subunit